MPPARPRYDNTTRVVLPTIAAYERSADECLSRWGDAAIDALLFSAG
jgi:hypothetical protein